MSGRYWSFQMMYKFLEAKKEAIPVVLKVRSLDHQQ
jgi:hypothetical protein